MPRSDPLAIYQRMRDFAQTPEPAGHVGATGEQLSFVVQKHAARSLHYDFRLELDGTLKSWAVPKGPSLDPHDKRMAVHVEDHPVSYGSFEGVIPPGHYGAGSVIVWDRGTWTPLADPQAGLRDGKLRFELHGSKLHGRWALVRMRKNANARQEAWLLMKEADHYARPADEFKVVDAQPDSVLNVAPSKPARKAAAPRKSEVKIVATTSSALPHDVRITHPERVIDAQSGVTKGELAAFYASVSALMLPHLRARPVALLRAPEGVAGSFFFQKHAEATQLPDLQTLDPALDLGHAPLLAVPSLRGLLGAAQMNVIEFHTWNATAGSIARPDRIVFDLDPGTGVNWNQVKEGAQLLHSFLDQLGMTCFLKTSGGKGLHLVVPLMPRHGWGVLKAFAQAIVQHVAQVVPGRFVAKSGPKNRVGKIYIDYLRNGFGATTVCAWSARARPGLGVSVPLAWDELDELAGADHWTVRNIGTRLAIGDTPWAGYATARQGLAAAMKKMAFDPEAVEE